MSASPFEEYRNTIVRFELEGHTAASNVALGEGAPEAVSRRLGLRFAVVTPANPMGRNLDSSANDARLDEFTAGLRRLGWPWLPADGCSLDGTHVERGAAIACSLEQALDLARSWDQAAIFWFSESGVEIVWT